MARTTALAVQDLLGGDYDGKRSLTIFINTANSVVNRVVVCATAKNKTILTDDLALMETWVAAYFYTKSDRTYASSGMGGASATYMTDPKEPEWYKNGALALDFTGCLRAILSGATASLAWGGKTDSEKLTYDERN